MQFPSILIPHIPHAWFLSLAVGVQPRYWRLALRLVIGVFQSLSLGRDRLKNLCFPRAERHFSTRFLGASRDFPQEDCGQVQRPGFAQDGHGGVSYRGERDQRRQVGAGVASSLAMGVQPRSLGLARCYHMRPRSLALADGSHAQPRSIVLAGRGHEQARSEPRAFRIVFVRAAEAMRSGNEAQPHVRRAEI